MRKMVVLCVIFLALVGCDGGAMGEALPKDGNASPLQPMRATNANPTVEAVYQAMDLAAEGTRSWVQQQALMGTIRAADTAMAAEGTAVAFRAWQTAQVLEYTAAAGRATSTAEEGGRLATMAARETADERAWIAQGWTATADAAQATGTAEANLRGTAWAATATQAAYNIQSTRDVAAAGAMATGEAVFAQLAEQKAERDRLDLEGRRLTYEFVAWLKVWGPWVLLAAILMLGWLVYGERRRNQVLQRDDKGMAPVLLMDGKVIDPERMLWPLLDSARPKLPEEGVQLRLVEGRPRNGTNGDSRGEGLPRIGDGRSAAAPLQTPLRRAEWGRFVEFEGEGLPIGVDDGGQLMVIDPERHPHRTVAGRTSGGKTFFGVRPTVGGALARGWYVATLGEIAPVGFHVFHGQPNYADVVVDEPSMILAYLDFILEEVKARFNILYHQGASRWGDVRGGGPRVLVVLDEYAALVDGLEGNNRRAFFRYTANISRLARKAGIHMLLGVQNPTSESIRPSVRRNTLTQTFQVADAAASRAIIEVDGAERLEGGQYLAVLEDGIRRGTAFGPSDDELTDYLAGRVGKVEVWERPVFLELEGERPSSLLHLAIGDLSPSPSPNKGGGRDDAGRLREFLVNNPTASKNAMCQFLWRQPNAGSYAARIDALLLLLRGGGYVAE